MSNYTKSYDLESDCLLIREEDRKIKQSVSLGNLTLDFDSDGRVAGIQLLNASEALHFTEEVDDPIEFLQNLDDVAINAKYFEDGLMVTVEVRKHQDGQKQEGIINSSTPSLAMA